jgi:hypothetical protein
MATGNLTLAHHSCSIAQEQLESEIPQNDEGDDIGGVSPLRENAALLADATLARTTAQATVSLWCKCDAQPPGYPSYHAPGQPADRVVLMATRTLPLTLSDHLRWA